MFKTEKMKLRNILIPGLTMVLLILPSCHHKSSDSSSYSYLSGSLSYSIPTYIFPGDEFILTPSGVTNPTAGTLGYYWYSSWDTARDTTKTETGSGDGSWDVIVPEEIGSYTITGVAYATGYYTSSTTKTIYVVDPTVNVSLTGAGYQTDSTTLVDTRDGGTYYLASTDGSTWTQNNLYYTNSGASYENSPAIDAIYGRLYTWTEAMEACPDGWHLPSDAEFAALAGAYVEGSSFKAGETFYGAAGVLMADAYFLGSKMWTFWPEVKINNNSKFSAIPVGYAIDQEGSLRFQGNNSYAVFWTSDEDEDGDYRYIYVDKNNVYMAMGDKDSFRASVRCVKD